MVLADGTLVKANAQEHEDLFWAVRGGGEAPKNPDGIGVFFCQKN